VKNSIQEGDTLPLAAPYAVASGGGALVGAIFGVAVTALANAEVGSFELKGVFTLPKATGVAATLGAKCYWDNTNKNVTATVGSNTLVGVFVAAYASGDTTANVRLNGSF
jgi:predicted RecA/RadA family phage recombinase